MKHEIRLALLCMAATAVPAFAQSPQCVPANFDQARNIFTVMNPTADAVNQQCFLTVHARGAMPDQSRQYPAFVEGSYVIELSGGGGGGGGGASASKDRSGGGGGGGASAARSRSVQYLAPGVYKLTLGTGGEGGRHDGGRTESGNPTSLTNANTGQLIAGFQGADVWAQRSVAAGSGSGGVAAAGGRSGGSGGQSTPKAEEATVAGTPGQAGGGGGSGIGSGGGGGTSGTNTAARDGRQGGHGFIKLTLQTPAAPAAQAPAPAFVEREPTSAMATAVAPAPVVRPMRRDRN